MARDVTTLGMVKEDIKKGEGAGRAAPSAAAGAPPGGPALEPIEIRQEKDIEKDIQVPQAGDVLCSKCNITFPSTAHLIKHISAMHENVKQFWCKECDKYFVSREGWRSHMSIHSEKKFRCDNWNHKSHPCNERFTTKRSKDKHMVNAHTPPLNTPCRFKCGKKFARMQYRNAHEKICRLNTNPNKIQCTMCEVAPFKTLRDWAAHCRRVHNFK